MIRIAVAALAVISVAGVIALLINDSRLVDGGYFARSADLNRQIQAIREDLGTIEADSTDAFAEGRRVPNTVAVALLRLAENRQALAEQLGDPNADVGVFRAWREFELAAAYLLRDATIFVRDQDAIAEALNRIQDDSPEVVKALRSRELPGASQDAFSLALDLIEFASGDFDGDAASLSERVGDFADDPALEAVSTPLLDGFLSAAGTLISGRQAAEAALQGIQRSAAPVRLEELSNTFEVASFIALGRADRARLLLSLCVLTLLGGIAFVVYRLHASNLAINRSNEELARMNETLEERVQERTSALSTAYDELKESQVQLVQAEKMSSLGELVAGISHEINTPLWYLINNTTIIDERMQTVEEFVATADEMIAALSARRDDAKLVLRDGLKQMRQRLSDGLKDDVQEASDLAKDSIEGLEELATLAQSLKDFSRLDRAQSGSFNVNDGLDKTLLITRNKLKNGIEVKRDFGDVPEIHCSPSQINQVFLNLITNAADAIESTGAIEVSTWPEGDTVRIRIADTGCGMDEDTLARIRNPFFTTKDVGKGTGLGLSIVDRIIDAHGGRLDIESEPDKGTIMTVTLPIQSSVKPDSELPDVDITSPATEPDAAELEASQRAANL